MRLAPNPRPEDFRFPSRAYEIPNPYDPDVFVEVIHLGPGGEYPPRVQRDWSSDEARDWYRVTVSHPLHHMDPELDINPDDFVTNEYASSREEYEKGREISRDLAQAMVLDLGSTFEDLAFSGEVGEPPDLDRYIAERTSGETTDEATRLDHWIRATFNFGVEVADAKDAIAKDPKALLLRRKPIEKLPKEWRPPTGR